MIGTKLAHFEITSHLGSGGMGDVYQATDGKLGRSVAIKFLPEAFSHDSERVARFQREARVLASLNHPNIAAIHGLEEVAGRHFLVMELVGGETLAQRIQNGAIPMDEALGIAVQITEALEEAHDKGIIHRDLKPANIKITPEGKVKVLDFGLAKAFESGPTNPSLTNSPTLSMAATNAGVILGTAAYMSPEQAKGRQVDRRTDIWAFGCVLYEMLTGRPAFEGEDVTQILARILEREPDWNRLPSTVRPRVRELLQRCLEKDVKKRRRDAGDVRVDIEQALSQPSEIVALPAAARSRERLWMSVASLLLIALAALAVPAVRYFRETSPTAREMRTEINTPASNVPLEFALSPDGTRLAFVANDSGAQRLWVRPLNAVTGQPLPGTDGADYPFWSPDSRSIGFFAGGKLKRIEIDGGPPQTLADAPVTRGGTWNQEGVILFSPTNIGPVWRVAATGGTPDVVTRLEQGENNHRFPQFLPDGRHFLFYVLGGQSGIYLGSLDGSDVKRLVTADSVGAWSPPGWLLYIQQGTLRAQALDIARGTLTGNPVTVADPVGYDPTSSNGGFSVSAMGILAYRSAAGSRTQLMWFDRTGKAGGAVGDPDENALGYPELSPDGRRVAVDRTVQGNQDIWLIDLQRGAATRFTFDAALDRRPLWSPDGTQLMFQAQGRKAATDLYTKPSSGAGAEQPLLESPRFMIGYSWSADGHFLLYGEDNPKTARDLLALPMSEANASPTGRSQQKNDGDRKPVPVVNSPYYEGGGQFSPDGRWVAYHSNESGRFEIYVVPFPTGGGKWQISTSGGISPRWRRDGKELFFIAPDGQMMAATVSASGTSFEAAPPVALFQTRIVGGGSNSGNKQQYAVSADGRFLINVPAVESTVSPITLLQNWKPPAR